MYVIYVNINGIYISNHPLKYYTLKQRNISKQRSNGCNATCFIEEDSDVATSRTDHI